MGRPRHIWSAVWRVLCGVLEQEGTRKGTVAKLHRLAEAYDRRFPELATVARALACYVLVVSVADLTTILRKLVDAFEASNGTLTGARLGEWLRRELEASRARK